MTGKSGFLEILLREVKLSVVLKCLRTFVEYNVSRDVLQIYTNYFFLFLTNLQA